MGQLHFFFKIIPGPGGLMGPPLAAGDQGLDRFDHLSLAWAETPPHWSMLQRMQYVDIRTWLADDLLVKADRMLTRLKPL